MCRCIDYKSWFSCSDECRRYQHQNVSSLVFWCCTKWCIGSRPSSQLIVLLNAGSNFPFVFILFLVVVSFAISFLFTCLLSLIDDEDESRMNDVSSARDLVDLS